MSQPASIVLRAHNVRFGKIVLPLTVMLFAGLGAQFGQAADELHDLRQVGSPVYLMLVSSPPVQTDIELTDEQKSEIAGLVQTYMRSAYEFHGHTLEMLDLPDLSHKNRMAVTSDMRAKLAVMAGKIDQQALAVLEPSQHKRLAQLRLRTMGAAILLEPRLREKLEISEKQLKLLKDAFAQRDKACQEYVTEAKKKGTSTPQEMKAKVDEIRSDAWSDMQRIFTATQRRILRDLLGPDPAFQPGEVKLMLTMKVH